MLDIFDECRENERLHAEDAQKDGEDEDGPPEGSEQGQEGEEPLGGEEQQLMDPSR